MKKNYEVLQESIKDCGSACLLSVIKYYGGNVPLDRLTDMTDTTKEGTTFYNLKEAANELGLSAKAYYVKNIKELPVNIGPVISQVIINNYKHFIVIYKINNNIVTIMDPAKGNMDIDIYKFENMWTGYFLMLTPYKTIPIYTEESYIKNILLNILYINKKLIINIFLLTMITTIFTLLYSYHFKFLIDNITIGSFFNGKVITFLFLIVVVIKYLTTYLRNNLLLYANQKIDLSILTASTDKILSLPLSYYRHKTTGDTIHRINDLLYLKNIIAKILTITIPDIMLSLLAFIILYIINSNMTLILSVVILAYILIFLIYKPIFKKFTFLNQEKSAYLNSSLVESISSYETIKGLNMETYFKDKIANNYLEVTNNNLLLSKKVNTSELLKNIFENIMLVLIIYLGIKNVMDKSMTIGSLVTYNSIVYYFLAPIRSSLDLYREFIYAKNSLNRINHLLDYKSESVDKPKRLSTLGGIYVKNLSFSYDKREDILKDITIDIKPKAKVLLLGGSGSGKSTLLKLLYKYYEIDRDKIFISGYDLNDFNVSDIRKNIAYISQNEFLYTDTIRNNIILDRNIQESEFLTICKLTRVDSIIKEKNISYDYPLEENGANLSGGERSRIILARMLLKKANIIMIDEGLNAIDVKLARNILKDLFQKYPECLFIIVTHRTDNMDLFSQIIKIDKGHLVEGLNKYV